MASRHALWRDEVHALSVATDGGDPLAMVAGIGDGHPALWTLSLRFAHDLLGVPQVLQVLAIVIAAAAMALLAGRSPFRWWPVALFAATQFALFDYAVVARNYGVSMLLLFVLAACFRGAATRGILPGLLLFLLANANVHSVVLVGAFLLFWGIEQVRRDGLRWTPALRVFVLNAGIAIAGVIACVLTVYPPDSDLPMSAAARPGIASLLSGLALPAFQFVDLTMKLPAVAMGIGWPPPFAGFAAAGLLLSAVMIASTLSLVRRPAAFAAALAALGGLDLIFLLLYAGSYRHQALWLVFLVALHWIVGRDGATGIGATPTIRRLEAIGQAALLLLLAMQVPGGVRAVADAAGGAAPYSRSRDLAALVRRTPGLGDAIILSEPDYLIEPLPYYLANPTYLPRERRFGRTAILTRRATMALSLGVLIDTATMLRGRARRPVLILLQADPDHPAAPRTVTLNYGRTFVIHPAEVDRLHRCARLLARFAPAATDESYGVYLLPRKPRPACR